VSRRRSLPVSGLIPQLRTTNLAESIRFYTTKAGLTLQFQYEDFYLYFGERRS
jgi:catechol 2,3-dioxygenase-like lactoylglutathione lyase family enzyme